MNQEPESLPSEGEENRRLLATILCLAIGFGVWVAISIASGTEHEGRFHVREAWDTPVYFWLGLPVLAVCAGIASFISAASVWRWPLMIVLGQAAGMIVAHPDGTSLALLPFTVLFIAIPLMVPLVLAASFGRMLSSMLVR